MRDTTNELLARELERRQQTHAGYMGAEPACSATWPGRPSLWCQACVLQAAALALRAEPAARGEAGASRPAPEPPADFPSEEIEAALKAYNENKDKPFEMVGPRQFQAMSGAAVVIVRQRDSLGRRHSNFIDLRVSTGLDGRAMAIEIAEALSAREAAPPAGQEPPDLRVAFESLSELGVTSGATVADVQRKCRVGAADAMRLFSIYLALKAVTAPAAREATPPQEGAK